MESKVTLSIVCHLPPSGMYSKLEKNKWEWIFWDGMTDGRTDADCFYIPLQRCWRGKGDKKAMNRVLCPMLTWKRRQASCLTGTRYIYWSFGLHRTQKEWRVSLKIYQNLLHNHTGSYWDNPLLLVQSCVQELKDCDQSLENIC